MNLVYHPPGDLTTRHEPPGLVVLETALALVLLIGATLMMRSFLYLRQLDPGFDTARQVTARLYLSNDRYPEAARRSGCQGG